MQSVCCVAQANDFERYKELMAQEQDAAANEKLEVIERFLRDTEEYLQRLTEKIASVQQNQEATVAAAAATAAARAQVRLLLRMLRTSRKVRIMFFLQRIRRVRGCCRIWVGVLRHRL